MGWRIFFKYFDSNEWTKDKALFEIGSSVLDDRVEYMTICTNKIGLLTGQAKQSLFLTIIAFPQVLCRILSANQNVGKTLFGSQIC